MDALNAPREMPQCECCASECRPHVTVDGYTYLRCVGCGYTFLAVSPDRDYTQRVYGEAYFSEGAYGYADYESERVLQRRHGREFGRLLRRHAPAGALLDVGCASGGMLQGFADEGWRGEGLEPNGTLAAAARRMAALTVHSAAMEDRLAPLQARFDAVTMIQVIAHFRDAAAALANAARYLRPDGLLLIETWNPASWTARVLGAQWHEFSPPATVRILTPGALNLLAGRCGFRLTDAGRPAKRILASHAKSLLRHKRGAGRFGAILETVARTLPDNAVLPYPAEDAYWHLYRLQ